MKKPKKIIKRRHPFGTKYKSCQINRTDRWISVVSNVIFGGLHFSPTGFAVHSSRDVTPEWIGAAVQQALETSEYLTPMEDIEILSSKSSRTGAHSAWPVNMNEGRVFHVSFAASDAEIGDMALRAFSRCEGPGKSTEPLFP